MKIYGITNNNGEIECYLSNKEKAALYIEALYNEAKETITCYDIKKPSYAAEWYYEVYNGQRFYERDFFLNEKNICNFKFVLKGKSYYVQEIKVE
jgi:hypothetical protein